MAEDNNLALAIGLSVAAFCFCLICCYSKYEQNKKDPIPYGLPRRYAACPVIPEGARVISVDMSLV
jgi:hypothetical protein